MERPKHTKTIANILLPGAGLLGCCAVLAVSFFVSVAQARPAAALLQDGLYAEEIDGDIDAAMKIYQQIISDESVPASTVAKAMYRLGMCHLKKQNEQQAKVVFEELVRRFPEQTAIVEKVRPLLDNMSNPDPAALMPADTKIYMELGTPGRQLEKILNMLKGTPFENPLAAIGGNQGGEKSPGDIMAALLNPSMLAEFKKVRGIAIGLAVVPVNVSNPRMVAVLYLGQSDALKGLLLAGLGMVGKPGETIEGMQTVLFGDEGGAAYDDKVMIIGQPLEQLTWSVKQYIGVTAEPTLASENRIFARLSRKSREENAVTIWLDGAATFAAISEQMARTGQSAQLKLADGVADFNSIQEVVASLSIGEQSIDVEANVGFKDGHRCLAYDLIRTPNLTRAGFEAVPAEAVAVVSLALGQLQPGQTERAQEAVKNLTGLDIGREIFANIEQVTLFALPPGEASSDSPLAQRFSPIAPCLGLAVTSHNPQKTQQLFNQLLAVAGLITNVSAGGQSGREAEEMTGRYKIGVVDNKPAYCYMEQVGRTTIVALSPEVLEASLSAAKNKRSALTAGPLRESLERLPAETSKLALVNVAGATRSADSYLSWQYDNPKNPGHRFLGQLAQTLDNTTVYLRTGEQLNSFNVHAGIEQIPPLGGVFPIAMQLSQTDLQAKARATEPRPSDGAVVAPGAKVELIWGPGAGAAGHRVYFGTDPDQLALLDERQESGYDKVPPLERNTTYYWRVDEVQADGSVIEGDVWSFSTGKLVAWWKFDETSGTTVADSGGGGHDGTAVHGKPIWDPSGKYGGCLNFDETYGFSIPKEVFSSIDKAITISVWVKGNEKQREHSDVILQAGAGDDGKPYIVSIYTDWLDYGLKFATGFGEPDRLEFNPGALEEWAGNWNHYAFVKDADEGFQRIYLNGTLVAEEKGKTSPMAGVGAARIGIAPDRFGDQYIGKLDDLRIYNYALSEQEIAALCPTPKASKPEPPNKAVIGPTGLLALSWRPGINAAKHKVYVGSGPDKLSSLTETTDPSYKGFAVLKPGATCYWRIDEVQADGSIVTGDLWSFSIRGLIGWWKLDGDAKDSSGNNHHGTIKGDPKWVTGRIDTALEFDGVDDYVDTGDTRRLPVWTVAVWVKSPAAPSSAMQSGPAHWEPNFHLNWDHKDPSFRGTASLQAQGRWYAASFGELEGNTWYHLCATYDGEHLKAYKDGVLITNESGPSGEPTAETATLKFGRHTLVEQYFAGTVDDVRVYNYALSDEEIQRLSRQVLSPDAAGAIPPKEGPMFESQIYDNSALDLETGAVISLPQPRAHVRVLGGVASPSPEWPAGFDVAWDNDAGGALMVGPGSGARIVALPAAKKDKWDQAIPMARRTLEVLGTSTAKGMFASQSRFVAVLTSEGNLAVVEIAEHDPEKAKLRWSVDKQQDTAHKILLPPRQALDLKSGKILPLPFDRYHDTEDLLRYMDELGKGDITYDDTEDASHAPAKVICTLRGADISPLETAKQSDFTVVDTRLNCACYALVMPCRVLITAGDGDKYQARMSYEHGGITVDYQKAQQVDRDKRLSENLGAEGWRLRRRQRPRQP